MLIRYKLIKIDYVYLIFRRRRYVVICDSRLSNRYTSIIIIIIIGTDVGQWREENPSPRTRKRTRHRRAVYYNIIILMYTSSFI